MARYNVLMMLSDVCLTSVCPTSVAYIRSAGGVCGRPAGWRVLADRARPGPARRRPGSRLPLRASVAGLGGGISWRPLVYSFLLLSLLLIISKCPSVHAKLFSRWVQVPQTNWMSAWPDCPLGPPMGPRHIRRRTSAETFGVVV